MRERDGKDEAKIFDLWPEIPFTEIGRLLIEGLIFGVKIKSLVWYLSVW